MEEQVRCSDCGEVATYTTLRCDSCIQLELELEQLYRDVRLYPSTAFVTGKMTRKEEITKLSKYLYDDLVCGRRISPIDIAKLVRIGELRHCFKFLQ